MSRLLINLADPHDSANFTATNANNVTFNITMDKGAAVYHPTLPMTTNEFRWTINVSADTRMTVEFMHKKMRVAGNCFNAAPGDDVQILVHIWEVVDAVLAA